MNKLNHRSGEFFFGCTIVGAPVWPTTSSHGFFSRTVGLRSGVVGRGAETVSDEVRLPTSAEAIAQALNRTPARLLVGRAGTSYRTDTWLKLRADHAAARDAVHAEVDLVRDFGRQRVDAYSLFWTQTRASSRADHLLRPDRGREDLS